MSAKVDATPSVSIVNDRSVIESPASPAIVKTRYIGARGAISRTIARTSGAIVSARGVLMTYAGDEITQLLGSGPTSGKYT